MSKTVKEVIRLAETNLAGATAVRWAPEAAHAPRNHAEAVASELLGPLAHADGHVAALRRRLLDRRWPEDARIVPHLVPQPGLTHRLTPRRVDNADLTSNNWSGSTIPGTWAHAVGIWRIPTVTVPSTPAGTDGGWDSSSWVGIDGTYGSNDVLQAGVQQSVHADGSTRYVAWYEWFAPFKAVLNETSPFGPALASLDGNLYIAWKGDGNDNLNVMVSTDQGQTFQKKLVSNESSPQAPSLAAHNGVLFIAWKGDGNDHLNVARVDLDASGFPTKLSNKVTLGDTSPLSPALASAGGNLYLAWRGDGNDQLNVMVSPDNGRSFGAKFTSGETSSAAPVLGTLNGGLMIAWKGDGNDNLNVARVDMTPAPTGLSGKVVLGDTSPVSPALAEQNGQLFIGWKGDGNDNLNVMSSADGRNFGNKLTSFEFSPQAPSLVGHNNTVFMGWTGEDNEALNVADLVELQTAAPGYVHQTNIANMPIEPGDEVFVGVHYRNRRGFVMFGNVDRGRYFSIELDPPPGATFSGNSVEWIVEAPNSGEPGTSLPRFTPVTFSAAFGSDANSTVTANPATGDTTNIVAFGRSLTSVSLATDALTVFYLDGGLFPLPGAAVFDHEKQRIAVVSRAPGNLDLFVIGFDNRVWSTFWNAAAGWNGDWFPLPGDAVFDRETQQVAAVSRAPGNLDLFVIGFDNHVWSTFWNEYSGWNGDWFPVPGQAVFDHQTQRVAAVTRAPGNLDLFVIGFDNRGWSTFWNDRGGWNGDWFPLPGQAVFDHARQQIAAVSRAPGNLDLFVIGFDNRVWSTFWNDHTGWSADWFPLPGEAVFDRERQQIAAVSRAAGNLDLFVLGFDNHAWSSFWNDHTGWSGDWFPLPGQAVFDHQTQQIAAVTRAAGNLDLFVIGFDNRVWSTFWNDAAGWASDWFPLPGQAVFDRQTQQLAAVSRAPGNLDLFVIGFDNHVWSEYWNDTVGWN
jgi:hypothetical protein